MVAREVKEALHFAWTMEFFRMAVLWTFSLVFSYFQLFCHSLFFRTSDFVHSQSKRPSTKTAISSSNAMRKPMCIITGATSGLGAAAACALSREGFYVVLVGRSSHLLSKVMSDIKSQNSDALLKAFQVDLSSFESILKFRGSLQQWMLDLDLHSSIQLLINNAGILATSARLTAEGCDEVIGVNYIGAFCFTKILLPLLENSPIPSRIINVTSFTHRNVSSIQVDKETVSGKCFSKSKTYPFAQAYEYSKLCLLLFTYELHRQFGLAGKSHRHSVIAVDPGAVKTNIMREVPSYLSQMAFWLLNLLNLLQSPGNGVSAILDAALSPPETSGVYFFGGNGRTLKSSALSYNSKLSKELWATSCDLFLELQQAYKDTPPLEFRDACYNN